MFRYHECAICGIMGASECSHRSLRKATPEESNSDDAAQGT